MRTSRRDMVRMQIIVPRAQKARMKRLAAQSNVSVSEIYRLAADAYSASDDDEIRHPQLETLIEVLEVGTQRARVALDRAEREVAATLEFYAARRDARKASAQDEAGE